MSAWTNIEKPESVKFVDIVSEEICRHLQTKKEISLLDASKNGWIWIESDECDKNLKCIETNINETSTLMLSHNDQSISLNNDFESHLKKEDIKDSCDIFDVLEDELMHNVEEFCSHKSQSSDEVINKYDIVLKGRKDDCKRSSLCPNFQNEDGKVTDFKSSYRFFKRLKIFEQQEEIDYFKLRTKCDELVMDPYTHILLYNMIASRLLKNVDYVINSGTEGIILHGVLDPSYPDATMDWPKHCAIKVFKKVSNSLRYNPSYLYKEGLVDKAKTVQWWAQKAMDNLISVRNAGVPCPQVIKLRKLVLVTSFIGKGRKPAPKLRYASLLYPDFVKAYEQVKNAMKMMYEKANFIHGDMSEYNILWHDKQCYFIDFTYSVNPGHDNGYYFLHCDCINVTNYFAKRIPDIMSAGELFMYITGFCYGDKILLQKLQNLYRENPYILHKPSEVLTDDFEREVPS